MRLTEVELNKILSKRVPGGAKTARNRQKLPKRSKYGNKRVEIDGIKFDSIKEGNRYKELQHLSINGEVLFFLRQVAFDLPGKVRYFADFLVFWADGTKTVEDVKGVRTDIYKLKKKQVEALYPIKIIEL